MQPTKSNSISQQREVFLIHLQLTALYRSALTKATIIWASQSRTSDKGTNRTVHLGSPGGDPAASDFSYI